MTEKQKTLLLKVFLGVILVVGLFFLAYYQKNKNDQSFAEYVEPMHSDQANEDVNVNKAEPKEDKEKPKQTAKVTAQTPEEKIRSAIQNIIDKEDIKILDVSKSNSGYDVVAALKGSESFTKNMTRDGLLIDSTGIFEQLYKTKLINMVTISWSLPLSDKYGNEEDTMVMKVKLTKATMDKIKWDNFSFKDLSNVADEFWMHPALE